LLVAVVTPVTLSEEVNGTRKKKHAGQVKHRAREPERNQHMLHSEGVLVLSRLTGALD
jgi:hypothetical protein